MVDHTPTDDTVLRQPAAPISPQEIDDRLKPEIERLTSERDAIKEGFSELLSKYFADFGLAYQPEHYATTDHGWYATQRTKVEAAHAAAKEAKRDAQRTEDDDALSAVAMRDLEEAAACDPWPIPAETHAAIAAIHASMAPPKTAPVVGAAAKDEEAEGLRPLTPDEIESGSYLLSRAKDDGIDMALLGRLCREEPDEAAKREVAEMMDKLNGGS